MRRGRPRHDDVLTPREWQVLDLLRDGLTNDQIAARLAISPDTAKFHVSEILSKLGVETRQQAAAWPGRPRGVPIAGLPAALGRILGSLSPLKLVAAAALTAAALGLAALAAGLILMDSKSPPAREASSSEIDTGDEALDAIIESVLNDDAPALARRFTGVTAREGSLVGGPVGLYQPKDVPSDEWIARLGSAARSLHAVVKDPSEPYDWWMQSPQPVPRAAVLAAPRDYDIVLVVEPAGSSPTPWRFSVVDGRVIDIVIDGGAGADTAPLPSRLADLTPSPDDEPGRFLVLPPEDQRLPPAGLGPGSGPRGEPQPQPAPVNSPSFAPSGRTGDAKLDAIIESLLTAGTATFAGDYGDLVGRRDACDPDCHSERFSSQDWTSVLGSAKRSLYAVYTGDPADVEVMIAVDTGARGAEAWRFKIDGGKLVEVEAYVPPPYKPSAWEENDPLYLVDEFTPSPSRYYPRFYVLPPRDRLPVPPAHQPISTRTGDAGVDRILDLLETRDADGLVAVVESADALFVRSCGDIDEVKDRAYAEEWAATTTDLDLRVHAVVRLPVGYQPPAEHLILLVTEVNPYRWQTLGVFERDGQIAGIVPLDDSCDPSSLYPPRLLVPPPAPDALLDRTRRSGIPAIDAVLDAIYAEDEAKLATLIDYPRVECSLEIGPGAPPYCPAGSSPGTLVQAIRTGCHGDYTPPDLAPARLVNMLADTALYLVAAPDPQPPASGVTTLGVVVLARQNEPDSAQGSQAIPRTYGIAALAIAETGITDVRPSGCGLTGAMQFVHSAYPDFLLPPP
jgi:DNA-binding CsgD family transcriptional regulator